MKIKYLAFIGALISVGAGVTPAGAQFDGEVGARGIMDWEKSAGAGEQAPGKPVAKASQPRVAVVGAGLAGLSAAWELKEKYGIDAEVYEARDRVGGRTSSIAGPGGTLLEEGAYFINTQDKALRALIKKFGLKEVPARPQWDITYVFSRPDGSAEMTDDDSRFYQRFLREFTQIKKDQRALGVDDEGELSRGFNLLAKAFDTLSVAQYLEGIKASSEFTQFVRMFLGSELGLALEQVNSLHLLTTLSIDPVKQEAYFLGEEWADEKLKLAAGNQAVALEIEKRLKPGSIHKNHVLRAVIQSGALSPFQLVFEGRQPVNVDYLILAVPFPVFREGAQARIALAVPDIKPAVHKLIETMPQGRNSKLFLFFNGRPWKERQHTGFVWSDRFLVWDSGYGEKGGTGALTAFFYDNAGFSNVERLKSDVLGVLEKVFPGISGRFIGLQVKDWPSDPLARGSYSGAKAPRQWAVGWPTPKDVSSGRLFFAGEQLGGDTFYGYMNGAVLSGQEAAGLLAKSLLLGSPGYCRERPCLRRKRPVSVGQAFPKAKS